MAASPTSERRARLIREMAQDLNRTRQSLHSNSDFADLTGSNLSVEEESSQAYRDHSQDLPTHRTDNKTNTRISGRPSLDFVIDSSAIGRAFPDMTGSGSSVDDGSSISIELGRGLRDGARNLSQDGESKDMTSTSSQYKIDLSKLPQRSHSNVGRSSLRQVQHVDDHVPRRSLPPLKATNYGTTSGSSRQSSGEHAGRQSYKATVEDGSNHTASSLGQPSTQNLTVRSSRFSRGHTKPEAALPKRFTSGKDLLQTVEETTTRANSSHKLTKPVDNPTVTTTNGGTAQSFLVPNISELVSGVFDDGTPVFSRTTAGRFKQAPKPSAPNYSAVQSLPVPQDEEAIMMSLRLLQDKVKELEKKKAEAEVLVKELQNKNQYLQDERKALKRSSRYDSGVGSSGGSDAGDEGGMDFRKGTMEKSRLQSTVRNLQNELDGANRRAAVAEANAVNVASERDSSISQLGVAFVTQEELKVDNEDLKAENRRLKIENKKYRAAIEAYIQRVEADKTDTKSKATEEEESAPHDTRSVDCQVLDVDTPKRPTTRRDVTGTKLPREGELAAQVSRQRGTSRSEITHDESAIQAPKRRKRRVIVEEYTATSDFNGFDDESVHRIHEASIQLSRATSRNNTQTRPVSRAASAKSAKEPESTRRNATKDLTRASAVSFLQDNDVTMLRKMLEKEHLQKKGRIPSSSDGKTVMNDDMDLLDVTKLNEQAAHPQALPRKSSMKDITGRLSVRPETTVHTEIEDEEQTNFSQTAPKHHRRRHSEESLASRGASKRRDQAREEMTSAFILPDVTMNIRPRRHSQGAVDQTAPLSVGPGGFEAAELHEAQNCTVCTRLLGTCDHSQDKSAEQVRIPKPILASERIRDLAMEGEDHTHRPSEPPSQALARTIKALEDEFAHLGMQLSTLQKQYNELDPSLQKRKRKSMGSQMDSLRAAMDAKGDQIYALYDVLEGQRKNGRLEDMTEQEVNDTLTSVLGEDGVPDDAANMATLGMPTGIMFKRGHKTSAADVTPAKERAKPRRMSLGSELSAISERTENKTRNTSRPASRGAGAGNDNDNDDARRSSVGARKFPSWAEPYDDFDDDVAESIPWEGFDDTLDLTRGSQKSNTSSKRRGGTATLEL